MTAPTDSAHTQRDSTDGVAELDAAAALRREADFAAWAADGEAERAALLAIPNERLEGLGLTRQRLRRRADALRVNNGVQR
ncbi:MAG: hypothetical protein MRY74_00560 [Neomegalonema sp.]|nr:hypothetical protein [Neomegalonema sp.]